MFKILAQYGNNIFAKSIGFGLFSYIKHYEIRSKNIISYTRSRFRNEIGIFELLLKRVILLCRKHVDDLPASDFGLKL